MSFEGGRAPAPSASRTTLPHSTAVLTDITAPEELDALLGSLAPSLAGAQPAEMEAGDLVALSDYFGRDHFWHHLVEYCETERVDGQPLIEDRDVRGFLTEIFAELEVIQLLEQRNAQLARSKKTRSYQGPQVVALKKAAHLRIAGLVQKMLGFQALLSGSDTSAAGVCIEQHQRAAIAGLAKGGSADLYKAVMARRLGVGLPDRKKAAS